MINYLVLNIFYFGILLFVILFFLVIILFEKINCFFLFVLLFVSMVFGVVFFYLIGILYKIYKIGGDIIYFFLELVIICFVILLYKKCEVFVKYWYCIIGGIGIGIVVVLLIILIFVKLV